MAHILPTFIMTAGRDGHLATQVTHKGVAWHARLAINADAAGIASTGVAIKTINPRGRQHAACLFDRAKKRHSGGFQHFDRGAATAAGFQMQSNRTNL